MQVILDVKKQCKISNTCSYCKLCNMCACCLGSSFQWSMGLIGRSTRANRPNHRCMGGHLLGATQGIIEGKKHGWALHRDIHIHKRNQPYLVCQKHPHTLPYNLHTSIYPSYLLNQSLHFCLM